MTGWWRRLRRWLSRDEEGERATVLRPYHEPRIAWPPPREDPREEPSHPGAFHDHRDDGWWERWKEQHGADA